MLWQGAAIHEFSIVGGPPPRHPYIGEVERYQQFLRQGKWDVIFFHSYAWTLYLSVPLLASIKAKKVIVSHGFGALVWVPVPRFPFGLVTLAFSALGSLQMLAWLKKIDCIVVLSKRRDFRAFYDHLLARVVGHKNIRVIPNGVDFTTEIAPGGDFRHRHEISERSLLFLCVANYSKRKDQGFAVRAFRRAAIPDSVLVFIGSEFNCYSDEFKNADAANNVVDPAGRIIWLEKQSRSDTVDALATCDVFVLSARHEGQPIVLLEAMSAGKPWIARDAGCISEMPGGICVGSEERMAREMRRLAGDPSSRIALGIRGREAVEAEYSRASYGNSYCRLVEELADS